MPASVCEVCKASRAQVLRPKNHQRLCGRCFISVFEAEVAETITSTNLFANGERVAIGASGGKDSTVLASVLKTLNDRHKWGLDLVLLSIDEGISGYRDHSLDAVRRNAATLELPLTIVSYAELYGWSMDQVVAQVGRKGNCTYCGVFRRQALDRGAARLGVAHVVTGHNADDVAETVVMNLLRGDLPRLSRATSIVTSTPAASMNTHCRSNDSVSFTNVKRSKPLMYAYEKEIVLYAHHMNLGYFSTECIYSPEAFRGSARTLIKNLERVRPESILDVIKSGIDMAKLVATAEERRAIANGYGSDFGGVPVDVDAGLKSCGDSAGVDYGGNMADMEQSLRQNEVASADGVETEIKLVTRHKSGIQRDKDAGSRRYFDSSIQTTPVSGAKTSESCQADDVRQSSKRTSAATETVHSSQQRLGKCQRCGYLSSQSICKACVLLEGLNKARPRTSVEVGGAG